MLNKKLGIRGTFEMDNSLYFYKRNSTFMEVFIEQIENLFGLNHAHYIPITVDGTKYYLSKDLNEIGPFTTAFDAGIFSSNINDIRSFVMEEYPDDFDSLMNDIIKMYFMDLLLLNYDRNNNNWGFLDKDGHVQIYLLDNDNCFSADKSIMTSLDRNPRRDSFLEIDNIIDTFPAEEVELFNTMFNMLDENAFTSAVEKTEEIIGQELPYKDYYLDLFRTHRKNVEKVKNRFRVTKNLN